MNSGSSSWLHLHVAGMAVGAQGALPGTHPAGWEGEGAVWVSGAGKWGDLRQWLWGLVSNGLRGWVKHPTGIGLAPFQVSHLRKPSFWDEISIWGQWQGDFFFTAL